MNKIFDRAKLKIDRDYSSKWHNDHFLRTFASNKIFERLNILGLNSGKALELGAFTGHLSTKLNMFDLKVSDISPIALSLNPCKQKVLIDEEQIDIDKNSYDVILSCLNLHWINDVEKFLAKIYHALKSKGVFIASFIGEDSLKSLRSHLIKLETSLSIEAKVHISPFIKKQDITYLMQQARFKNVVADSDCLEVSYPSCLALMQDLKKMGESNKIISSNRQNINRKVYKYLLNNSQDFVTEFIIITVCGTK